MKTIAIAAVTVGGKTTIVNELKKQIANTKVLHFDDYSFEGEVDDFYEWTKQGADYNVWNLSPLVKDVIDKKFRLRLFVIRLSFCILSRSFKRVY